MHGLGPELVTVPFKGFTVDGAVTRDRPEPPRAGRVFEVAANGWIDGTGEYTLPL